MVKPEKILYVNIFKFCEQIDFHNFHIVITTR